MSPKLPLTILLITALSVCVVSSAFAQNPARPQPASLDKLKIESPNQGSGAMPRLDASLAKAQGPTQVIARLSAGSVGELVSSSDLTLDKTPAGQRKQFNSVKEQQNRLIGTFTSLDPKAKVLGTAQRARNPGELGVLLINDATRGSVKSGAALKYEAAPVFVKQ
jgi:hypothetical protein